MSIGPLRRCSREAQMGEVADDICDQMIDEELRHARGECEWGCPLCEKEAALNKEPKA